jgi:hypothetical protein
MITFALIQVTVHFAPKFPEAETWKMPLQGDAYM